MDRLAVADFVVPADAVAIKATPYLGRDPATIPPRPWVYGRYLLRKTVTALIAPGGVGKTKLIASTALALSTGRSILDKTVWKRPQRAWIWNLEDDGDELAREIEAAAIHHRICAADWGDRLFVDSGLDGARLCTAIEEDGQFKIQRPEMEALTAELIAREIDVLFVDPFVSSHQVDENHNSRIDEVAKEWARTAAAANCSIVLSHHTKKLQGQRVTAEMSRGAVALINAARFALVLNRLDKEDAERFGIAGEDERRRYFSVQDDKHNRVPADKATWLKLESVDLGNIDPNTGRSDLVGVVTAWTPPDAFDGITPEHLYRVQVAISEGNYKESVQAADWAGKAVAIALGLDADDNEDKARIKRLLKEWITNGALVKVDEKDPKRRETKPFIRVGQWAVPGACPTSQRLGSAE